MKNVLLIVFVLLCIGLPAQTPPTAPSTAPSLEVPVEEKSARIGAGLGCSFAGFRDETDLPLNRYINAFTFVFNGNIEKGPRFHSFNLGVFGGELQPLEIAQDEQFFSYFQNAAVFTRLYLEYALDYRLWGNQAFPGYLGGSLRGDMYFAYLRQTFYYSFTGIISLNIHASQKWNINARNSLIFSAGLPVVGFAARPPYNGIFLSLFDFDQKITSLHNYWAVFGDLKYYHKVNALLSLNTGLGFEFSHINFPQPRRDAIFRLNAGIAFTF